jgi:2-succinyl-6-hydroxy-2,4-cyclohexadiene-1-carboxylate synthase
VTRLGHDTSGVVGGRRVVFVHGFTQTRRSWDGVRSELDDRFATVAVDAPGHGGSSDVRLDLPGTAAAVGDVGGLATYVGYSMGGRMVLHLAVSRPDLVERLVLVSATAGIDDDRERVDRRASDERLAASIERGGVAAFLDQWLALPLFHTLPASAAARADRERNSAVGLASSLRLAGTGTQQPLWDRLPALTMPVLVVAGELDSKFVNAAERLAQLLPHASLHVAPGSGHTVHLEQPDWFVRTLAEWLDDSEPDREATA